MAFLCDNCQLIFPDRMTNCPICGGRVIQSTETEEELLQEGFEFARVPGVREKSFQNGPFRPSINDGDLLAALKRDYDQQHRHRTGGAPPQTGTSAPPSGSRTAATPPLERGDDFFAAFAPVRDPLNHIPFVEPAALSTFDVPDPLEENRRLTQEIRSTVYRLAVLNFLGRIRWGTVARILVAAALAGGLWALWRMRYVILNSIFNFLISLLPTILVIWFLARVIRSIFKR